MRLDVSGFRMVPVNLHVSRVANSENLVISFRDICGGVDSDAFLLLYSHILCMFPLLFRMNSRIGDR